MSWSVLGHAPRIIGSIDGLNMACHFVNACVGDAHCTSFRQQACQCTLFDQRFEIFRMARARHRIQERPTVLHLTCIHAPDKGRASLTIIKHLAPVAPQSQRPPHLGAPARAAHFGVPLVGSTTIQS
jgi:hypothetical protein